MDHTGLWNKKKALEKCRDKIDAVTLSSYEEDFELTFTHHSTAIEGNTLTLLETKLVLEDGIAVGGKALREIYEVVNHKKAYRYIKKCLAKNKRLDENIVKDIHEILMENIMQGGIYRNQEVRISGSEHTPPSGNDMFIQIKNFYADFSRMEEKLTVLAFAAWTHAEFVRVHPFVDGNGRTARLLMNYQLMYYGFLPISISKNERLAYYDVLEEYAVNGNLEPFTALISDLEEKRLDLYLKLAGLSMEGDVPSADCRNVENGEKAKKETEKNEQI